MYVSAPTSQALAGYLGAIAGMRADLKAGVLSAEDVERKLTRRTRCTLDRAARSYMDAGLALNTRRRVASALATHLRELAPLELLDLEPKRLVAWIERMRRAHLGAGTIAMQWRTLRAIVRHAAERGWIAQSPWGIWRPTSRAGRAGRDRLPREATRSPAELGRLLEAAEQLDAIEREGTFYGRGELTAKIACAALLGLRQRELAGLRWSDVEWDACEVAIVRQGEGQPTKARTVDVLQASPRLFEVLEAHRRRLMDACLYLVDGPVFPWRGDPVVHALGLIVSYPPRSDVLSSRALRRAVERAGLPNVERWTPHSLRDSFVTLESVGAGGDLAALARRSRHGSTASLFRYLRALQRGPASAAPGFTIPERLALPAAPTEPR